MPIYTRHAHCIARALLELSPDREIVHDVSWHKDLVTLKTNHARGFRRSGEMPTIGKPEQVKWHGLTALRIEVDGTKTMTKETKLYYFFDPKTHDELGVSADLGSVTQVELFSDLKINPKIEDSVFQFVPPKGWKLVKN